MESPQTPQSQLAQYNLGSIGSFVTSLWTTYQKNITDFLVLGILIGLPGILFSLASFFVFKEAVVRPNIFTALYLPYGIGIFSILLLLTLLWPQYVQIAFYRFLQQPEEQRNLAAAFRDISWALYWRVAGASFLVGFFVIGGFILLVVPGIYLANIFLLVPVVLIMENLTIGQAMEESRKLVRGSWWGVFGRYILLGILIIVFSFVVNIILQLALHPITASNNFTAEFIGSQLTSIVTNTVTLPIPVIGIYLLYNILHTIKSAQT